jgi:hypothetical protein
MTGRTNCTDIRKDRLNMAAHARDALVKSAQGKAGLLIVPEIRNCPHGFPRCGGVTAFACQADLAVRIAGPLLRRLSFGTGAHTQHDEYPHECESKES